MSKPKKKTGPKPRPAALVRRLVIRVLVTEDEFERIMVRAHAGRGYGSMSAYLREKGLAR